MIMEAYACVTAEEIVAATITMYRVIMFAETNGEEGVVGWCLAAIGAEVRRMRALIEASGQSPVHFGRFFVTSSVSTLVGTMLVAEHAAQMNWNDAVEQPPESVARSPR